MTATEQTLTIAGKNIVIPAYKVAAVMRKYGTAEMAVGVFENHVQTFFDEVVAEDQEQLLNTILTHIQNDTLTPAIVLEIKNRALEY